MNQIVYNLGRVLIHWGARADYRPLAKLGARLCVRGLRGARGAR